MIAFNIIYIKSIFWSNFLLTSKVNVKRLEHPSFHIFVVHMWFISKRHGSLTEKMKYGWLNVGENCLARCPLWHPMVAVDYGNFAHTAEIDALWILAGRKTRTERTVNYQGFLFFPAKYISPRLLATLPDRFVKQKNHFHTLQFK